MEFTKIKVEPFKEDVLLARGKTVATEENLTQKIAYAASRAPKFTHITITRPNGHVARVVTREEAENIINPSLNPAAPAAPAPGKASAKGKKTVKTKKTGKAGKSDKTKTGKDTPASKTKPGVIISIITLLKGAVDEGGVTVQDMVDKLAKEFPDRKAAAMETTVRCQLGRLPKERKLNVIKQREGRVIRYCISGTVVTNAKQPSANK